MELIYSMRRKPLKCEPPHFENPLDTEVVRPIVTISVCNIIGFSTPTELSDADGDTWGGHVYVCDLDTPWDSHKVTSTVHPVSALEWDNEGKQLLVGTTAGDVSVYGPKEHLLNEWTCLYSANFPGEHIIRAIFFHNGRRVVAGDKKPDALNTEKFQLLRSAPTLKGFGGGRSGGALVVSSSGLVGAVWGGDSPRALHAAEPLPPARLRVTTAAMAHKSGGIVVAAGCGGSVNGSGGGRWCVRCAVAKPRAPPHLALQPLPALYLPTAGDHPVTISWCLRDDIDCLLVAGTTLTLWKLTEGAHPVHKLFSKGPLQGSTTPNGGPKTGSDCFNTVVWQPSSPWILEEGEGAVKVSGHKLQLAPPYVLLATPRNLHLLSRDKHHVICSRAVPLNVNVSETPTCAGTPPKKPKYGPGALPSSTESCATVCGMDTSSLGGVVAAIDTHARLHVYTLPYCADVPSPVAIQHICNLLEYSMVSGIDCLDVLMTIKSGLVEPIYESFTESFLRQPPTFQQYYYHSWLKIRIALCRLIPSLSMSASWLTAIQMCHYAWAAALPALRPDDRPEHNLMLSLDEGDSDKTLLTLEAKPECLGDVSSLQPLRRQLQRALDVAVTALLSLQHSTHQSHGYEIWSDASAVTVLRKLVVVARASGRGGEALSRPLSRLHTATAKHELQEECASLWAQSANGARSWEGAPRCSITAPHGRPHPLYLEYGVEPEGLKFTPDPPSYLQADVPPPRQMDTIRYMYLGGGGLPAKCKQCGRCGALAAHHSTHHHRHALLAAADARLTHRCRCGGKWTLVSNV